MRELPGIENGDQLIFIRRVFHIERFRRPAHRAVEHIFTRGVGHARELLLVDQFGNAVDGRMLQGAQPFLSRLFHLRCPATMKPTDPATRDRWVFTSRAAVFRMSRALTVTYGVLRAYLVALLEWSPRCVTPAAEGGVTGGHC